MSSPASSASAAAALASAARASLLCREPSVLETPANNFVCAMLTDLYQITMAYAYWLSNRHEDSAVFDLFFRKAPFKGEFTIFAGLEEVIRLIAGFRFSDSDVAYLRTVMPTCDPKFFDWLRQVDCSQIKVYALPEGSICFPRVPLIRVEGPLAIAQLLETPMLNLVNYPSLICTNALRFRLAAGPNKRLLEFGVRRAQGPDGAISASRYSFMGGFDATSDVLAGKLFGIEVRGTHAHAFVSSFTKLEDLHTRTLKDNQGVEQEFVSIVLQYRVQLGFLNTNMGELTAFIAYAQAFPSGLVALVDTYDTLSSGVPNFLCVALALQRLGYRAIGIRLDSGDLAYLSLGSRKLFQETGKKVGVDLSYLCIVASNDINEETLISLNHQGHEIDQYGIGTHLVTCQSQPALGCVYKLVEINGSPRIKLSQDINKVTIPGRKEAYRLVGTAGYALFDLLVQVGAPPPEVGKRILCRHPFDEVKRAFVTPTKVIKLHELIWDGRLCVTMPSLAEIRYRVQKGIESLREDHKRSLNPTPFKVSVTEQLYDFIHRLWLEEAPISEVNE